jgi:hypothetical protein
MCVFVGRCVHVCWRVSACVQVCVCVELARIVYIPHMTVYLMISLPKITIYTLYIHMVLANPMYVCMRVCVRVCVCVSVCVRVCM